MVGEREGLVGGTSVRTVGMDAVFLGDPAERVTNPDQHRENDVRGGPSLLFVWFT